MASVEVKKGYPPNIKKIKEHLPITKDTVFTYGAVIYNPQGDKIEPDLMLHEHVHVAQQAEYGVEEWWAKYLEDPEFRLSQELPAFGAQYSFGRRCYLTKVSDQMLDDFAARLSDGIYGQLIEYHKARTLIRHKAHEYDMKAQEKPKRKKRK